MTCEGYWYWPPEAEGLDCYIRGTDYHDPFNIVQSIPKAAITHIPHLWECGDRVYWKMVDGEKVYLDENGEPEKFVQISMFDILKNL